MKNSATVQNAKNGSSLFQVAARFDDSVVAAAGKHTTSLNQTPLADLMLHPEKVETVLAVLEVTKIEGFPTGQDFAKHATHSAAPKKRGDAKPSPDSLVKTTFHLEAPLAKSVKLAADFTDWEKASVNLIKSQGGVWYTVVSLPPGEYSYRFIVDGEWCDDPRSALRVSNPFGTVNAVVKVI